MSGDVLAARFVAIDKRCTTDVRHACIEKDDYYRQYIAYNVTQYRIFDEAMCCSDRDN